MYCEIVSYFLWLPNSSAASLSISDNNLPLVLYILMIAGWALAGCLLYPFLLPLTKTLQSTKIHALTSLP